MKIFDIDSWQEIWATITRNKFRSVATGFGVFWGLFMLIVLLAIGTKLSQGIRGQIGGFATNSIFMGPDRTSEAYKGYRKGRYWAFENSDIELIRQKSRTVDVVSPMLWGGGSDRNVVRGMKSGTYRFQGVYPNIFDISAVNLINGRLINEIDVAGQRKVCMIGSTVYETLFNPGENPDGQFIRINGIYFQVVGVMSALSQANIGSPVDETIYLPYTTQQMLFERSDNFWFLALTAKPGISAAETEAEVKKILMTAHDISPTDTKAIWSTNVELQFKAVNGVITAVSILMWIVGLGALLSGIIGISNIMLVTVRERMREIGVRRALGAKPADIIVQIMSESFILTAIAGLLGFLCGVGVSLFVEKMNFVPTDIRSIAIDEPVVSFNLALAAMTVLVLSGIAAGLLPAWRALKIKAIDALSDE